MRSAVSIPVGCAFRPSAATRIPQMLHAMIACHPLFGVRPEHSITNLVFSPWTAAVGCETGHFALSIQHCHYSDIPVIFRTSLSLSGRCSRLLSRYRHSLLYPLVSCIVAVCSFGIVAILYIAAWFIVVLARLQFAPSCSQSCESSSSPGQCCRRSSASSYCAPHQKQYAYSWRKYASTRSSLAPGCTERRNLNECP